MNENCLEGMCCPKCLSLGPFKIAITCMALVGDDGTEEENQVEWDDKSYCECTECVYCGKVKNFRLPDQEIKRVEKTAKKNLPLLLGQLRTEEGKHALEKKLKDD